MSLAAAHVRARLGSQCHDGHHHYRHRYLHRHPLHFTTLALGASLLRHFPCPPPPPGLPPPTTTHHRHYSTTATNFNSPPPPLPVPHHHHRLLHFTTWALGVSLLRHFTTSPPFLSCPL
eukprot:11590309-Alexandrium_andersonii.AAC.1